MNYMAKSDVIFDNIRLSSYEAYAIGCPDLFTKPQRDLQLIEVPGRNGNLIIDNQRYKDVPRYYRVVVPDYQQCLTLLSDLATKQSDYYELTDEYDSTVYMQAMYNGSRVIKFVGDAVLIELQFTRKPQLFLLNGRSKYYMSASSTITNPTDYDALPIIRVWGSGTLGIGSTTISVDEENENEYIDIDCFNQNAYYGSYSRNSNIFLVSGKFFKLVPGVNNVSIANITQIAITPRWWKI